MVGQVILEVTKPTRKTQTCNGLRKPESLIINGFPANQLKYVAGAQWYELPGIWWNTVEKYSGGW